MDKKLYLIAIHKNQFNSSGAMIVGMDSTIIKTIYPVRNVKNPSNIATFVVFLGNLGLKRTF